MRKIIAFTIAMLMLLTSFSFALDLDDTVKYLEKQNVDEWGILALYSYGKDINDRKLKKVDHSKITTDYEAYILGAVALGEDVSDYAKKIVKAQMENGKFADYIDGSGEELVNAHIWGVISLYVANNNAYDKQKALLWLKENQNEDGGFSVFSGTKQSDIDLTAMALIAYEILGLDENSQEVKKAITFIEKHLEQKESCESVAYYILARKKLGLDIDKNLYNKLLQYQTKDGAFKHLKNGNKANYMATWHGLLALVDYKNSFSIFTKLHNLNRFKDLKKGDYAYEEIINLVNRKIVSGYPDGTFRPNHYVKRGEFANLLVYGMNLQNQIGKETNVFIDLKGHWANKIVSVAVKNGFISGIGNKKFAPEDKITGAQVATLIVKAKGLEKEAEKIKGNNWYDGYVSLAKKYDLLYENFHPEKYATRAQCAKVISKLKK